MLKVCLSLNYKYTTKTNFKELDNMIDKVTHHYYDAHFLNNSKLKKKLWQQQLRKSDKNIALALNWSIKKN